MFRRVLSGLFLLIASLCMAQLTEAERHLQFRPVFHGARVIGGGGQVLTDGTPVTIAQFRFYVSHVTQYSKGAPVSDESGCHLIDAFDPSSLVVPLHLAEGAVVDSLSFLLGIDSLTNVSGAFGGALDPTKGMYWAWNSGYINLKLEGTSPVCSSVKHAFQFHLGGYLTPYVSARTIGLPVSQQGSIMVAVDVADLLARVDLAKRSTIMSPSAEAVELSRIAATVFNVLAHE